MTARIPVEYFSSKSLMHRFEWRCLHDFVDSGAEAAAGSIRPRVDPDTEIKIYRAIPHNVRFCRVPDILAAVIGVEDSWAFRRNHGVRMQRPGQV